MPCILMSFDPETKRITHAIELVLDCPGFSETFDLLDFSKWSRRWVKMF